MADAKKGGGAIDRAVAHFSAQEVRTIELPEWGDEDGPLLIYVEPFTLREQGRLHKASSGGGDATGSRTDLARPVRDRYLYWRS